MQRHNSSFLLATQLSGCVWAGGHSGWKARREFSQARLATASSLRAFGAWWIIMQIPMRKGLSSMVTLRAACFLPSVHSSGDTSGLTRTSEQLVLAATAAGIATYPDKHLSLASPVYVQLRCSQVQSFPGPRIWFPTKSSEQKWGNYPCGKINFPSEIRNQIICWRHSRVQVCCCM